LATDRRSVLAAEILEKGVAARNDNARVPA
jgi:hypothetical protein